MSGTKAGNAKLVKPCPRGCGRNTLRNLAECYPCRKGWPPPGVARSCETCGQLLPGARRARRCVSCKLRESHRRGAFARAGLKRGDRWTPAEDAEIRAMAGRFTSREIGKRIGRSYAAVDNHARKIGVSLQSADWSAARIAALFGNTTNASSSSLQRWWLETGVLPGRKAGGRSRGGLAGEWHVREQDLERFIVACPWAYDARKMFPQSHRLAQLGVRMQRRDPWLYVDEVAEMLGLARTTVVRWVDLGVIPHQRRHVGASRGGVGGVIVIREADVEPARQAIEKRHAEAHAKRHLNLEAIRQQRVAARAAREERAA